MNTNKEIEIKKLLKRARKNWQDARNLWKKDPDSFVIDEPLEDDYIAEAIHEYKYGK